MNNISPIEETFPSIRNETKLIQSLKTSLSISMISPCIVAYSKLMHEEKAWPSMDLAFLGIIIDVKLLQYSNDL